MKLTGREREPLRPVEEFLAVVGRRGGKSRVLATLAAYISGLAIPPHADLISGPKRHLEWNFLAAVKVVVRSGEKSHALERTAP